MIRSIRVNEIRGFFRRKMQKTQRGMGASIAPFSYIFMMLFPELILRYKIM